MSYKPPGIEGWMSDVDLQWLYEKAREMKSIVEIGSWKGRSTHALLSGCKGPVFAIDNFKGNPEELMGSHKEATERDISIDFKQNVGHFPNLVLMRMDSVDAAQFFRPQSVDMVFIDGSHSEVDVTADIKSWLPICRRLLCGHDWTVVRGAIESMGLKIEREGDDIWSLTR